MTGAPRSAANDGSAPALPGRAGCVHTAIRLQDGGVEPLWDIIALSLGLASHERSTVIVGLTGRRPSGSG
jgi:hypothetical protein